MSAIAQAFSYFTGFFTPLGSADLPTSSSDSSATASHKQPAEAGNSYFPDTASRRSSLSSAASGSQESLPGKLAPSYTGHNPLDAMMRAYPEPAQEIDVAKQLALEPRKHSLHHSLKRAATAERSMIAEDADTKAKKLAAAKAELLALAGKA